jgi:hypothetical protein
MFRGVEAWLANQRTVAPADMAIARTVDLLLAIVALALFVAANAFAAERSMPSRVAPFQVQDHDPYLTQVARTGAPLIAAIQGFRAKYGRCPGLTDQAELAPFLPPDVKIVEIFQGGFALSHGEIAPWMYQVPAQDPRQCSLSRKLSWDPDLVYRFDGASGQWFYAPGDGRDDVPLAIDP